MPIYDQLIEAHPDRVRQLLERGLTNRNKLFGEADIRVPADWIVRGIVAELGCLGNRETADLLRHYLPEPVFGQLVTEAIRRIERRE